MTHPHSSPKADPHATPNAATARSALHLTLILSIVSVFLAIPLAHAELSVQLVRHDTDVVSTYEQLKTCSCGSTTDAIRVKNLGQLAATYQFELRADQPWFHLDRSSVALEAGESVDLYVFTETPCGAVGTGTYTVYASSEYGRYRAIEKTIQTGVCENILTTLTPAQATIMPCSEGVFTLDLTNVGSFTENYRIEGLYFPSVTLDAGEHVTLRGGYTAGCGEWGERDVPVTITSQRNGLVETRTARITVPRAYDYGIAFSELPSPVCAGVTTRFPITVTNIEDRANTIAIQTSGAGGTWNSTVTAKANREVVIDVPFTPTRAGNRELVVSATGNNGGITKEARLTIPVEACYGVTVAAPRTVEACAGSVLVPFTVTSTASRAQRIALDLRSNTTTSIDTLGLTLQSGQTATKAVQVAIPDADRSWYVTLGATATDTSRDAGTAASAGTAIAHDETTVAVQGYSTETCYWVRPTSHQFRVWTDQTILPIVITHTGHQPATYSVQYNGTYATAVEKEITLAPGAQGVVHLALNATNQATGRRVDRLTLSTAGVDYTTDIELTLREKGFWEQLADTCRADNGFRICSIASVLAVLVLIAAVVLALLVITRVYAFQNPETRSKEQWGLVGGLVLAALLVGMLMTVPSIPRTYERPIGPSSPQDLAFQLGEGQRITIDLSSYFADPDLDRLSFSVNQPEHLRVSVQGKIATVSADTSYRGTEYVVFTAKDGRGGYTTSDVFTITIVPYRPVSFLELWQRSCWFSTLFALALAVTILLLIVLLTPRRKEPRSISVIEDVPRASTNENVSVVVEGKGFQELTPLERDVVMQAQTMVNAERIIINQNQGEQLFVASADGKRFHRMTCPIVKAMPKDRRVTFDSKDQAIKGGYSPCKTCSSHAA